MKKALIYDAGINRSCLANIEMGNRSFGVDTLEKLLNGIGVSYEEFFKPLD